MDQPSRALTAGFIMAFDPLNAWLSQKFNIDNSVVAATATAVWAALAVGSCRAHTRGATKAAAKATAKGDGANGVKVKEEPTDNGGSNSNSNLNLNPNSNSNSNSDSNSNRRGAGAVGWAMAASFVAGVALGLAALSKPTAVFVSPAFLLALHRNGPHRVPLSSYAALLLGGALAYGPWVVYNHTNGSPLLPNGGWPSEALVKNNAFVRMAVLDRSFLYYGRALLAHSPVYCLAFLSLWPLRARRHQRGLPHEVGPNEGAPPTVTTTIMHHRQHVTTASNTCFYFIFKFIFDKSSVHNAHPLEHHYRRMESMTRMLNLTRLNHRAHLAGM